MSGFSDAIAASDQAMLAVIEAIESRRSFVLEAGAGAGKTHSLVTAINFMLSKDTARRRNQFQQLACITYTNVAKEEISRRVDNDPRVRCDTIHGFLWRLIEPFQAQIRDILPTLGVWDKHFEQGPPLLKQTIKYDLASRSISPDILSIHHDDVITIAARLLDNSKFRAIMGSKYPVIFIDEYQDSNAELISSFKRNFFDEGHGPVIGFFGDHWQKIYERTCGSIDHPNLVRIEKNANFRSSPRVVNALNRLRPELPQIAARDDLAGTVTVFHTNSWIAERQLKGQWKGDLNTDAAHSAMTITRSHLSKQGWEFSSPNLKILMLTHRLLGEEQGYSSLPKIFSDNAQFSQLQNPHIKYLVEKVEPAALFYKEKRYGAMLNALGGHLPRFRSPHAKRSWTMLMDGLIELRTAGTVSDVLSWIRKSTLIRTPDSLTEFELGLEGDAEKDGRSTALEKLLQISYQEIVEFARFYHEQSPFATNHGVKGREYDDVLVVIGRGWSWYNFDRMLTMLSSSRSGLVPERDAAFFERNRNLFYVACSRPRNRLALLFTQKLSEKALTELNFLFGPESVHPLEEQ